MKIFKPTHITEDDNDSLDDLYEQTRINSLPEPWQRIATNHQLDQWQATPSIIEQNAEELRHNSLRQS
jgi:hypothetical protein